MDNAGKSEGRVYKIVIDPKTGNPRSKKDVYGNLLPQPDKFYKVGKNPWQMVVVSPYKLLKVDLSIRGRDETTEENEGVFISLNDDDDNRNNKPDKDEGEIILSGEDDLIPINISLIPQDLTFGELMLEWEPSDKIKIWRDKRRGILAPSQWSVGIDEIPDTLYIEGVNSGEALLTLTYENYEIIREDSVLLFISPVDLKSVSFSAKDTARFYNLISDNGETKFSAPHWQDNSSPLDGDADDKGDRRYPIAYIRNTKMQISAIFKFDTLPDNPSIKIKGLLPDNLNIPETIPIIDLDNKELKLNKVETSNSLKDEIDIYNPLEIRWQISFDDGITWQNVGISKNQVYVIWDTTDLDEDMRIHTLYHFGCEAAEGVSGVPAIYDEQVLDKIWARIQKGVNKGGSEYKPITRASDGLVLTYYGFRDENGNGKWDEGIDTDFNFPDLCKVNTTKGLIKERNGQCGAWINFMNDVLKAQGLFSINGLDNRAIEVKPKSPYTDFAVKNWETNGDAPWTIVDWYAGITGEEEKSVYYNEAADRKGVSGQGNSPNPPSNFYYHLIIKIHDEYYYDPSYGIGPYTDLKDYEDEAFAGGIKHDDNGKIILDFLPHNNGNPNDDTDLINTYTISLFPK